MLCALHNVVMATKNKVAKNFIKLFLLLNITRFGQIGLLNWQINVNTEVYINNRYKLQWQFVCLRVELALNRHKQFPG